jgi:hypothetical protein
MRLALGLGTRPANPSQPATTSSPAQTSHDSVRQRRRFAQDGDVPVVILHRGRDSETGGENKLAALGAELREERAARAKSERALDEANQLISSLKTQLKHTEMTLEEKLRRESEFRVQADALLATERQARQQAETKGAEAALALSILERKMEAASKPTPQPQVVEPAAPTHDLFGNVDSCAVSPASAKRRMNRKTGSLPEERAVSAAKPQPAPKHAAEPPDDEEDKPIEWWLPSFRAARKAPARRRRATN